MKNILLMSAIIFISGCAMITKPIYKAEVKHATEWKTEKLEELLVKLIEKGELTEKQAEKIREGAYWLLDKIIERAEGKLVELEEK